MKRHDRLPGFRDFFPDPVPHPDLARMAERLHLFSSWRKVVTRYGFREYDGPPLETLELYKAKSGAEIVHQLYHFEDKGSREVALRAEMTPTLARMIAAHARNYKKPIKWFSIPQLFRYERQQKGRLREHFQLNADILGEGDPTADAELIALCIDVLRALGLTQEDFVIRLSSRHAWESFFKQRQKDTTKEYLFYQIIDKLERELPENSAQKLAEMGIDYEEVRAFIEQAEPTEELQEIIDQLQARGLKDFVRVDYGVIRGLAYYTGVVFEAFDRQGTHRAIAGGGRYNHLIELISGGKVDMPALGFGMGDVVLGDMLREKNLLPSAKPSIDAFVQYTDPDQRMEVISLVHQLRESGRRVEWGLSPSGANRQWKAAAEMGATCFLSLVQEGLWEVKHLQTKESHQVASEHVSVTLDRLEKDTPSKA